MTPTHAIAWFEIPVSNIDRAQAFYETVLGRPMRRETMGPQTLAVFAYDAASGSGGALLHSPYAPASGPGGALVYLNAEPSLEAATQRALAAGAQLLLPRVDLPDGMGAFVHIGDAEGNRVGLHAPT